MKSLVIHGFGDLRIDEVPYPKLQPSWVIAKMRVVQPSITEVLLSRGLPTFEVGKIARLLEKNGPTPLFGHEFCAEVVEVGEGVERIKKGDRVASLGKAPCGQCRDCRTGRKGRCRLGQSMSYDIPGSRFAEFAALPEEALVRVPENVSDAEAAALQPLSECVTSVVSADISVGDTTAVLGQGVMGLSTMQVLRATGAGFTLTTDIRDEPLHLSKELGADATVNALMSDPVKEAMALTDNDGLDVVFETSGGSQKLGLSGSTGLAQALSMVKNEGKIVQVSILASPIEFDIEKFRGKGVDYVFPVHSTLESLEHAARLVSTGQVRLRPMITHELHGLDKVQEAFEITANKAKYKALNPAQVIISQ